MTYEAGLKGITVYRGEVEGILVTDDSEKKNHEEKVIIRYYQKKH